MRRRIAEANPEDGILGEEFPERPGSSGYRWILDPIDGTKSFIHGVPLFGTLVAVEHDGRGVVGVVLIPALDECVYAATGQGAWYTIAGSSPRPARVSTRRRFVRRVVSHERSGQFHHDQPARTFMTAWNRVRGWLAPGATATATSWWPPAAPN